ncbi:MAG: hypothetical protein KDD82_17090 [Planctomycetes bacterium]|nr:hypothetical protein [Planctomycetota bacterium]
MALIGAFLAAIEPLTQAYVPWAGAGATVLGALLLGVGRTPKGGFAVREVALLLSVCGAIALSAAVFVGSEREWEPRVLGAFLLGAWAQTISGVVLSLRLALDAERAKGLFGVGAGGAALLAVAHGVLIVLGLG